MRYEIDRVGAAGKLYLEQEDILSVSAYQSLNPFDNGQVNAARLRVRPRKQYQTEEAFHWSGTGKDLYLYLIRRQVLEIVAQDREARQAFCSNCYDYGKASSPPAACTRCLLLEACRKSGQGDYRKVKPAQPAGPQAGYGVMMLGLLGLWVFQLNATASVWMRLEAANAELSRLRPLAEKPIRKRRSPLPHYNYNYHADVRPVRLK